MTLPFNNVAHHLLAIGCDEAVCQEIVQCHSLSKSVSHRARYDKTAHSEELQCYSHAEGHRTRYDKTALHKNMKCPSHSDGHMTRYDDTAFQKNV